MARKADRHEVLLPVLEAFLAGLICGRARIDGKRTVFPQRKAEWG